MLEKVFSEVFTGTIPMDESEVQHVSEIGAWALAILEVRGGQFL